MPELHLVEYSDDNNPTESVAPYPSNTNQDGLPPLVDVPDEEDEEDDQMADEDDFEMEEIEEPVEIDNIQFNGDGSH